nr:MAG TPA: hypothetical protein [Caudoviricetes sp.]
MPAAFMRCLSLTSIFSATIKYIIILNTISVIHMYSAIVVIALLKSIV